MYIRIDAEKGLEEQRQRRSSCTFNLYEMCNIFSDVTICHIKTNGTTFERKRPDSLC